MKYKYINITQNSIRLCFTSYHLSQIINLIHILVFNNYIYYNSMQLYNNQIIACELLSSFTKNNQIIHPKQIMRSIEFLANIKTKLKIVLKQQFCVICKSNDFQQQQSQILDCNHKVHYQCLYQDIKQKIKSISFNSLEQLYEYKIEQFVCNNCKKESQINFQISNKIREQIGTQLVKKLYKQQIQFKCQYCKRILKMNTENLIILDCEHKCCQKCIKLDVTSTLIKDNHQISCKICKFNISQHIIKNLVEQKLFDKYRDLTHKNLKIDNSNVVIRPCKGYVLIKNDSYISPLNNSRINMQHFENQCCYFRNNIDKLPNDHTLCPSLYSYDLQEDKNIKSVTCLVCKLQMCVNGCQTLHKSLSCQQYNAQQLIFKSFVEFFRIPSQYLDLRGNRDYVKSNLKPSKINNELYFPPHGFKQYGINIQKYPNDGWLGKDQKAWPVMYHGVRMAHNRTSKQQSIFISILKNNLIPGPKQAYQDTICVRTHQKIGKGIYGSPHVEVCSSGYANYNTNVKDISYCVVIKCRVRPEAIRVCKKTSDLKRNEAQYLNDYWVINNPKDIRPYAFLLKRK